MSIEKVEIIVSTLKKQIEIYEKQADVARKEADEHEGAFQALDQLAKQMPAFAASIEKRIEADLELGSSAGKVSIYCKNVIARFTAMCSGNSQAQRNNKFVCEGRRDAADMVIANMEKEIAVSTSYEDRRQELEKEKSEAEKVEDSETEDKKVKLGFERAADAKEAADGVAIEVDELVAGKAPKNGKAKKPAAKKPRKKRASRKKPAKPDKPVEELKSGNMPAIPTPSVLGREAPVPTPSKAAPDKTD